MSFLADLSVSSMEELKLTYAIGRNCTYVPTLYQSDCTKSIQDVDINSTSQKVYYNTTHDMVSVFHSIDKAGIGNSTIWDATNSTMQVCQVIDVILPASQSGGNGKMVISRGKHKLSVKVDTEALFNISAALAGGVVSNETRTVDVSSYVMAFRCKSPDDYTSDDSALGPNDAIYICVMSKSNDVKVDNIITMVRHDTYHIDHI